MQKYSDVVLDRKGNVVTTALVLVKELGTSTPATIYGANSTLLPQSNPISVDNLGRFSFYAPNGRYSLEVYIGAALFSVSNDILLEDPADATPEVIDGGVIKNSTLENVTIDGAPPLSPAYLSAPDGDTKVGAGIRTQADKNADQISVLDFVPKTQLNGTTSNQAGIVAAVAAAKARGCELFWPAFLVDYVSDDDIPGFHDVKHVGNGAWLKRGSSTYKIENSGSNRNILYVSPTGAGDGLSAAQPAAWTSVFNYIRDKGPVLGGRWRVQMAAGTYPRIAEQITGFSAEYYLEIFGPSVSYGTPTAIIDAANAAWGLYFTGNLSVWFKDVKGINATDGGVAAAFICDNMNICFADNVHTDNTQWAGVNANNCSRLIVYGGRYENSVTAGLKAYGGTLVSIGRDTNRPQLVSCGQGVALQGGAYGHVDYCDYINCATGLEGTYQVHASAYQSTFTNCPVAIECDVQSSNINVDAYTLSHMTGVATIMRCVGSALPSERKYENQFFPFSGVNGRSSFGYTAYVVPNCKFQYSKDGTTAGFNLSGLAPATALWESNGNTILALAAPDANYSALWFANSTSARHAELRASAGAFSMLANGATTWTFSAVRLAPGTDNTQPIGSASLRPSVIFAGTGTINTSDERCKREIKPVDDACLRAWSKVEYMQYKFDDAVESKGDGARWHFGLVAQRVRDVFEAEGLNAFQYGLLCFDEWEAQDGLYHNRKLGRVYIPGVDGGPDTVLQEDVEEHQPIHGVWEFTHEESETVQEAIEAGNRYGIRYEEAHSLEAACERWQRKQLESLVADLAAQVAELKAKVN